MSNIKQTITVPIKGMHCRSCEILIEDNLKEVKGVDKAELNYRQGEAVIHYSENKPSLDQLSEAINRAGYSIGTPENKSQLFSHHKADYKDLGIAAVFLAAIYFLLKGLGLNNFNISALSGDLTVPVVLLVGLTAGFSTCMALVGGLVLGVSAKHADKHPEATPSQKMRPHLFFNLGRVIAFALLGGLLGALGSVFQLSGLALGGLTLLVGVVMLIMGLQLVGIFPWADRFKLTLPKGLGRALGLSQHQQEYNHRGAMVLGALTFFLPCGFTQAMQVYAVASGNFTSGAIIMGAFALGTLPGLLSVGGLTSVIKGALARRFFKLAGLAVIIFAVFNIANGLNLTGWNNLAYGKADSLNLNDPNVTIVNGVQEVRMRETAAGYQPNSFTVAKDAPVKWIITAEAPYSCASSIILSKYNIRKNLVAGENIIEFTPTEAGKLKFSCSMGMYTGVFNVVDPNAAASQTAQQAVATNNNQAVPAGSSCGVAGATTGGGCGGGATTGGGCGAGGGGCGCGGGGKPYVPTTPSNTTPTEPAVKADAVKTQVIKTSFTVSDDIQPNTFTVKAGTPVQFIVDPKEDGIGCMSAIMIQTLYPNPIPIRAGQPIVMNFTPTQPGSYLITCAMNVPRGKIIVQ